MSSVAKPWLNSWPLHSVGNTGPILSSQNVTPRFSMCSISTNILTALATVPDQEVGHLSWDRDFCELKQQIWGIYGLVWWKSVLWRQCTTLAVVEYVIFVLWIFSPVGHKTQKWVTHGNLIVGLCLCFKMPFWTIEATTALQALKVETFWYGNE